METLTISEIRKSLLGCEVCNDKGIITTSEFGNELCPNCGNEINKLSDQELRQLLHRCYDMLFCIKIQNIAEHEGRKTVVSKAIDEWNRTVY